MGRPRNKAQQAQDEGNRIRRAIINWLADNRFCVRHFNRVIREERAPGGVIVAVPYFVKFFKERDQLLM
jgi:hypothetical protein